MDREDELQQWMGDIKTDIMDSILEWLDDGDYLNEEGQILRKRFWRKFIADKGTMKALCIKEPWASLIASGKKTIETRTWNTSYRGWILLCASKHPKGPLSGMAFAHAEIIDCHPMLVKDEKAACCEKYYNAWSWVLGEVRSIEPFPVKGKLGLFEVRHEY